MKLLAIALLTFILVSSSVLSSYALTSSEVKKKVTDAISKQVEGDWSHLKLVIIRESGQARVTVYNTTQPAPTPVPTGNISKVCLVGDLSGSTVPNLMKGCNLKIGLGDLGYQSDLKWFKSLNFNHCVPGNHDTKEDGSSSLESETIAYCGDHWIQKIGTSSLIIGLNTNGNADTQIQTVKAALSENSQVKTVIVVSHKGGHVPPNSHHPAEASQLYAQVEQLVSPSMKLIEVFAHNHVSSSAPSKNWYQAGSGGKSHYSCGTDSIWTFCDNSNWAYLELTINNNNGDTAAKFIK